MVVFRHPDGGAPAADAPPSPVQSCRRRRLPALALLLTLLGAATPASAAQDPVRWTSGGAVWSTSLEAFDTFIRTGVVGDRGLQHALARSGWPQDQMRAALVKTYSVDLVALSRFLDSDAGVAFLRRATVAYAPFAAGRSTAVPALRSAILQDAADGVISSVGIMRALPINFRLVEGRDGQPTICASGRCRPGTGQCTSLLSWYAFLPACLQASQQRSASGSALR